MGSLKVTIDECDLPEMPEMIFDAIDMTKTIVIVILIIFLAL